MAQCGGSHGLSENQMPIHAHLARVDSPGLQQQQIKAAVSHVHPVTQLRGALLSPLHIFLSLMIHLRYLQHKQKISEMC